MCAFITNYTYRDCRGKNIEPNKIVVEIHKKNINCQLLNLIKIFEYKKIKQTNNKLEELSGCLFDKVMHFCQLNLIHSFTSTFYKKFDQTMI